MAIKALLTVFLLPFSFTLSKQALSMLRPSGILILLLIISTPSVAQEVQEPNVHFSHPTLDRINLMVDSMHYKPAIDLALKTAAQMRTQSNWEGYISFILRAAEIETFEVWKGKGHKGIDIYPDYGRPQKYLQTLNKNAGKVIDSYPYLKANCLFTSAVVYGWLNMPDTAESLHNQGLELRKKIYGDSSREVADSYLWRGVLYNRGLLRQDMAKQDLQIATDIQKKYFPHSRYALGSAYFRLAAISMETYQFDEALTLTNQYLSLYQDLPYEQAFGYQSQANIYWYQHDFNKSLESRRKAIEIFKKSNFEKDLITEYINLSSDLVGLEQFEEAVHALEESERILKTSDVRDPTNEYMLYENFGNLYSEMKKYNKAAFYFEKAMQIVLEQYGDRNNEIAEIYNLRGQSLINQMHFEKALEDYHNMLTALIPDFTSSDYHTIPDVQYEHPYFKNIIAADFNKGDAFFNWYKHESEIRYLNLALRNYKAAYQQIVIARQSIGDDLSKPFLMSNFQSSVENSIYCAHMLYRKTKDKHFIQDMLYFVELTKYLNVLDALQRAERASNSTVPVELLVSLENTRNELGKLQAIELQHQHLALSIDSVGILRDQILDLINTRRNLTSKISKHATNEGTSINLVNMVDTQKQLEDDEQILEFFWGTDSILVISLTQESAEVSSISNSMEIDSLFISVGNILKGERSFKTHTVEQYSRMTFSIYQKLFQPLITKSKIIVIPDGPLNLIPVDALVKKHQPDRLTFKDLNYLLYDYEITYAYSSSILFYKPRKKRIAIDEVLAFSYSDDNSQGLSSFRQDKFSPIPGTYEELQTLSRLFNNVTYFTGENALKANFINHAGNGDLIHLGVHGIGDPKVVDNSRLIFRTDDREPGNLYAYDIYNLKINARLVVLSGCETGLGRRQTGEGIFSIARAFSYAGCPSVVMTMWRVPDTFTVPIVDEFYEQLHDGQSIGASLRTAKLKFLEGADELSAHPANWAEFVLNGQDQSFQKQAMSLRTWLIFAIVVMLLAYFALKYKRII